MEHDTKVTQQKRRQIPFQIQNRGDKATEKL